MINDIFKEAKCILLKEVAKISNYIYTTIFFFKGSLATKLDLTQY